MNASLGPPAARRYSPLTLRKTVSLTHLLTDAHEPMNVQQVVIRTDSRKPVSFDVGRQHESREEEDDVETKPEVERNCFDRLWIRYRRGEWVIIPEPKKKRQVLHWVDVWDMFIWTTTLFTVFFVPVDVVMVKNDATLGLVIHLILNVAFTLDMVLTFFLAYKISSDSSRGKSKYTQLWELDPKQIAKRYMQPGARGGYKSGWFWADFLCVAPGWLEFILRNKFVTTPSIQLRTAARLGLVARFIAPLTQPFMSKSSRWDRFVERVHQEYGQSALGSGRLINFVINTSIICHWLACSWIAVEGRLVRGFISYKADAGESWLTQLIATKGDPCIPDAQSNSLCVYMVALYWAWTTLSSVGYGDIVPMNAVEYTMCTIALVISYFLSAFVIASFASLLSAFLDTHSVQFEQDMRLLDSMLDARSVSKSLKSRIRGYMYRSQDAIRLRNQAAFLENQRLSHGLQCEVARETLKSVHLWSAVSWAADLSDDILLELTRVLYPELYGPQEDIPSNGNFMLIMRSGLAAFKGHILCRGDVWGHESILLTSPGLVDKLPLKTLSFCDALQLRKSDLHHICHDNPEADMYLRRVQIKIAVRRAVIQTASTLRAGKTHAEAKAQILELDTKHFYRASTHATFSAASASQPCQQSAFDNLSEAQRNSRKSSFSRAVTPRRDTHITRVLSETHKQHEESNVRLDRIEANIGQLMETLFNVANEVRRQSE